MSNPDTPRSPEARCFACDRPLTGQGFPVDTRDDQIVSVGSDCYQEILIAGEMGWQPPKGGPCLYPLRSRPVSLKEFETALDAVVSASWRGGRDGSADGCPDEYAAVYSAYQWLLAAYESLSAPTLPEPPGLAPEIRDRIKQNMAHAKESNFIGVWVDAAHLEALLAASTPLERNA